MGGWACEGTRRGTGTERVCRPPSRRGVGQRAARGASGAAAEEACKQGEQGDAPYNTTPPERTPFWRGVFELGGDERYVPVVAAQSTHHPLGVQPPHTGRQASPQAVPQLHTAVSEVPRTKAAQVRPNSNRVPNRFHNFPCTRRVSQTTSNGTSPRSTRRGQGYLVSALCGDFLWGRFFFVFWGARPPRGRVFCAAPARRAHRGRRDAHPPPTTRCGVVVAPPEKTAAFGSQLCVPLEGQQKYLATRGVFVQHAPRPAALAMGVCVCTARPPPNHARNRVCARAVAASARYARPPLGLGAGDEGGQSVHARRPSPAPSGFRLHPGCKRARTRPPRSPPPPPPPPPTPSLRTVGGEIGAASSLAPKVGPLGLVRGGGGGGGARTRRLVPRQHTLTPPFSPFSRPKRWVRTSKRRP